MSRTLNFIVFLIFSTSLNVVLAIITGRSTNGRHYICLENGKRCPTVNYGEQNSINPRIVTPDDNCPSGYFPCYGIETPCGERLIEIATLRDGSTKKGENPWQAYLRNQTHQFSGSGALLDSYNVLTAAHKVEGNQENPEDLTVYMGVWDPTQLDDAQSTSVKEVLIHEAYVKDTLLNDVAILRLANPVVLGVQDTVNTICLPDNDDNFTGISCTVAGWGQSSFIDFDAPTYPPKQVTVTVADSDACKESFSQPHLLGDFVDVYLDQVGEICAGGEALKDACTQDGGSPLVCPNPEGKLTVAGLVLWGKNCGQPGVYGVYLNVPYYLPWITASIENLNVKYNK